MLGCVRTHLPALCAALLLAGLGCDESPSGPPPPEPIPRSAAAPGPGTVPPPSAAPPRNPWSGARVGDAVAYTYSYESGFIQRPESRRELHASVRLEVVSIQSPWVWVQATVKVVGAATPERRFLIPVDQERVPSPPPHPGLPPGTSASRRELRIGDVPATCVAGGADERPGDGPVTSWCDSDAPEHYLARRLWETSSGGGHRGFMRSKFEATFLQRGAEGRAAPPPPGLPRLFSADTWCRRIPVSVHHGAVGEELQESFIGGWGVARRRALSRVLRTPEDLRRTDLLNIADGWYDADAWFEEPSGSLLDAVLFIARMEGQQPGPDEKATPGRFRLASREVESRIFKDSVFHREYAADPWDPALDGLPWSMRWGPLFEMQLPDGRPRGDRLWECGPGPLSPSPMPPGELPDRVGSQDVSRLVKAPELRKACGEPPLSRKPTPTIVPYLLRMQVEPDGSVQSATLSAAGTGTAKRDVPARRLRCLEDSFRKLRFPVHRLHMPPVETLIMLRR